MHIIAYKKVYNKFNLDFYKHAWLGQPFNQIMACWVIFHDFMSPADLFQNQLFHNNSDFRVSNSLAPDQAQHSVGPDLGPDCGKDLQQTTKFE